jgi:hypothetical protein
MVSVTSVNRVLGIRGGSGVPPPADDSQGIDLAGDPDRVSATAAGGASAVSMPTQDIDVVWKLPSGDFDNTAGCQRRLNLDPLGTRGF